MRRLLIILFFFVALSLFFLSACSPKDKNEWQTRAREYVPLEQLDNNLIKAPDIIIQFQQKEISQIGPAVDKVRNFLDSQGRIKEVKNGIWVEIKAIPQSAEELMDVYRGKSKYLYGYRVFIADLTKGSRIIAVSGNRASGVRGMFTGPGTVNNSFLNEFKPIYKSCQEAIKKNKPIILEGLVTIHNEEIYLLPHRSLFEGRETRIILDWDGM